jgi:hypothetical protein
MRTDQPRPATTEPAMRGRAESLAQQTTGLVPPPPASWVTSQIRVWPSQDMAYIVKLLAASRRRRRRSRRHDDDGGTLNRSASVMRSLAHYMAELRRCRSPMVLDADTNGSSPRCTPLVTSGDRRGVSKTPRSRTRRKMSTERLPPRLSPTPAASPSRWRTSGSSRSGLARNPYTAGVLCAKVPEAYPGFVHGEGRSRRPCAGWAQARDASSDLVGAGARHRPRALHGRHGRHGPQAILPLNYAAPRHARRRLDGPSLLPSPRRQPARSPSTLWWHSHGSVGRHVRSPASGPSRPSTPS